MLTLNDGRSELWQWDTGRTLSVDADCSQVHFSNKVFGRSIDVDVVDRVAGIPDVLLQTDKDLNVWAFVGTAENGYTKISKTFKVNRRNKPADYVFTPVEQTTIAEIVAIAQSVRDDADAGLFDGAQGPAGPIGPVGPQGKQGLTGPKGDTGPKGEQGAQGLQGVQGEKGEKGDKGDKGDTGPAGPSGANGKDGAPGHTPEYGVDYGTPEQIQGIAQKAAEVLQPEVNQLKDDLANKVSKTDYAPETKTDDMTQAVGKDVNGKLWTTPGSGGSDTKEPDIVCDITLDEEVGIVEITKDKNGNPLNLKSFAVACVVVGTASNKQNGYGNIYINGDVWLTSQDNFTRQSGSFRTNFTLSKYMKYFRINSFAYRDSCEINENGFINASAAFQLMYVNNSAINRLGGGSDSESNIGRTVRIKCEQNTVFGVGSRIIIYDFG